MLKGLSAKISDYIMKSKRHLAGGKIYGTLPMLLHKTSKECFFGRGYMYNGPDNFKPTLYTFRDKATCFILPLYPRFGWMYGILRNLRDFPLGEGSQVSSRAAQKSLQEPSWY